MKELQGKLCLVTGGTRGIGKATVLALAEAGADVVFSFQSSTTQADEVTELIRASGVRGQGYRADVSSEDQVEEMLNTESHQ